MKVGALITARLKSTRLKKKALLEIQNKTVINHLVDRLNFASKVDQVILCTSTNEEDDELAMAASQYGIECFRGDEDDVIERIYMASKYYALDYVISVTADNPLVDPWYVDAVVDEFKKTDADLVTALHLPIGTFSYGIKPQALAKVVQIKDDKNTEFWGKYFLETGMFEVKELPIEEECRRKDIRLTIDYPQDFELVCQIFSNLYRGSGEVFSTRDIVQFLDLNPDVNKINQCCHEFYEKRAKEQVGIKLKDEYSATVS